MGVGEGREGGDVALRLLEAGGLRLVLERGEALEQELMKVTRQMDKKIRLIDWCTQNLGRKEEPIVQPTAALAQPAAPRAPMASPASAPHCLRGDVREDHGHRGGRPPS